MDSEEKYRAMPDRSHYILCSDRLTQINEIGKRAFYYTFIVALLLSAGSMFDIKFNILSLLSDLTTGRTSTGATGAILSGMLNIITSLFLIVMAILGRSRYKFCHVFLFSMYLAMPISCLMDFGGRGSDIITFGLGVAGVYIYFPTLKAWRDYKFISKVEGFPYFSERFAQQLENPKYKSDQYREDYADVEIPMEEIQNELISNITPVQNVSSREKIDMDLPSETPVEVPHRGDGRKNRENKKSRLELARELAEKANKFDFEIDKDK